MLRLQGVSFAALGGLDGRADRADQRTDVARRILVVHGGRHGAATLVAHHDDQTRAQVLDGVFDASEREVVNHVASHADHKQIADGLVEHDFRARARIGTAHDEGERLLVVGRLGPLVPGGVGHARGAADEAGIAFVQHGKRLVRGHRPAGRAAPGGLGRASSATEQEGRREHAERENGDSELHRVRL